MDGEVQGTYLVQFAGFLPTHIVCTYHYCTNSERDGRSFQDICFFSHLCFGAIEHPPTILTNKTSARSTMTSPPVTFLKPTPRDIEESVDQLRAAFYREQAHYPTCTDYLLKGASSDSIGVTENWRRRLCEWIFEVVDHFGFDREVVSIALDYLDRSVALTTKSTSEPIPKREFQLFAVTSLYIAIKVHGETDATDGPRLKLKVSTFEELSRGLFQKETIEAMEVRILSMLKWRMNPPTSAQFIALMLRLLPKWLTIEHEQTYQEVASRLFDVAKYLTELSCFDSKFAFQAKPSIVAYASILCAIESISYSMHLPNDIHLQLLRNISAAIKIIAPSDPQVIRMQGMLKKLSPDLFSAPRLTRTVSVLDFEIDDKAADSITRASPVCVCVGDDDDVHCPPRKRNRTGEP